MNLFKKNIILLTTALYFLGFFTISLADNENVRIKNPWVYENINSILDGTLATYEKGISDKLQAGDDPREIFFFYRLPSLKSSKQLLENGEKSLDPSKFLSLVMFSHDSYFTDIELKQSLVKFALDKQADPNVIDKFSFLPSLELSNLLLNNEKKPLSSQNFLQLIVENFIEHDQDPIEKQKVLIDLALSRGAKFSDITYFKYCGSLPSIELANIMLDGSINLTGFRELVSCSSCYKPNYETGSYEISKELTNRKEFLLQLVDKKIAEQYVIFTESSNVNLFPDYPNIGIAYPTDGLEIVLQNKLDPNKELESAMGLPCRKVNSSTGANEVNNELINIRLNAVETALKNGASPDKLLEIAIAQMLPRTDSVYEPLSLTEQQPLIEIALMSGANFSNVHFDDEIGLPSYEMAAFALNGFMDPGSFITLMFASTCKKYNPNTDISEISNDEIKHRNDLIKLALTKDGNLKQIGYCSIPPSLEVAKLLLEKGMSPNELLELAVSCHAKDHTYVSTQKELVELALANGAQLDQLHNQETAEIFRKKEGFIYRHQGLLERQLGLFFSKFSTAVDNAKEISDRFNKTEGYCYGLTRLWLHSKWIQFSQKEEATKYNNDWFKATTKLISTWNGIKELSSEEMDNIKRFALWIDYLQNSSHGFTDLGTLDTFGNTLKKKYSIVIAVSTPAELSSLLKEMVHDDELIDISINSGKVGHANGLIKHQGVYYYYEPDSTWNEYKNTSVDKIAQIIFNKKFDINRLQGNNFILGFAVYSFNENANTYPEQDKFWSNVKQSLSQDELIEGIKRAMSIDCQKSEKFFMEQLNNK
jgi:hypothetical protein